MRERKVFPQQIPIAAPTTWLYKFALFYLQNFKMAKKEWRLVPEPELTEQEVRKWFNRLRELYKDATTHIHEIKLVVKEKNLRIEELQIEIWKLRKENKHLKYELEMMEKKENKQVKEPKNKTEKADFKKRFFDSL